MKTEIQISLDIIGGKFDPQVFTRLSKVEPSKSWKSGDIWGNQKVPRREDYWGIETGKIKSHDLNKCVVALTRILKGKENLILKTARRLNLSLQLSCVVYYRDISPALYLESKIVKWISALDAQLDIDLYHLHE